MESRNDSFSRSELSLALLSLVPILYVFLSYISSPYHYVILVTESGFGEWLTVATLLVVFYIALKCALRLRREGKPCFFIACFGLGALFIAMEEISWGEKILGFDITAISSRNEQNEVNIHNMVGNKNIEPVAGWVFLLYGVVFPLVLAGSKGLRKFIERINIPFPTTGAVPIFIVVFACYILRDRLGKSVEIAELFVSFGLLATAVDFSRVEEREKTGRNRGIAGLFGKAVVAALFLTVFGGFLGGAAVSSHLMQFAEFHYPRQGMTGQSLTSLKTAARIGEEGHEYPYGLSRSGVYLSRAYKYDETGREGRRDFCLQKAERLGELDLLGSMHRMGVMYREQGKHDRSKLVLQQAEEWAEGFIKQRQDKEKLQYMMNKILVSRGKGKEARRLNRKRTKAYRRDQAYIKVLRERFQRD